MEQEKFDRERLDETFEKQFAKGQPYCQTCFLPKINHLYEVGATSPIGPLAWSCCVLIPISAPRAYLLAIGKAGFGVLEHAGGIDAVCEQTRTATVTR